jgi:amino acid transporter
LARDLSVSELSSFGVSSSAPLTVVAGAAVAMFALALPGLPLYFLAVGAVAGVWVIGYAALSRHVQSAGAQATFIMRGLGRTPGVAAQGLALVAYPAIYICLYGLFGAVCVPLSARWLGWDGPWWVWAGAACALVGFLGRRRAKRVGQVLKMLMAAEIVAVLALDFAALSFPAGGRYDLSDLDPASITGPSMFGAGSGAALAFCWACLIGFEEVPGLAEEARDGRRSVRRALLIVVGFLGLFYAASFAALSIGEGPGRIAQVAADPGSGFPFDLLAGAYGPAGPVLADVANLLLVTSVFAALASFHTVCTRYVYAAGRDEVLPAVLGEVNPRLGSPALASRVVTLAAAVVIAVCGCTGIDPVTGLFTAGSYVAAVGVLALMIGSSLAVVGYFNRHPDLGGMITTVFAPLLAALLMIGAWLVIVFQAQTMIGATRFGPLHLALLALPLAGALAGLLRAVAMRRDTNHDPTQWVRVGQLTPAEADAQFPLAAKDASYERVKL